jgi:hypothetical protein
MLQTFQTQLSGKALLSLAKEKQKLESCFCSDFGKKDLWLDFLTKFVSKLFATIWTVKGKSASAECHSYRLRFLRPILNFAPRGKIWSPGGNFVPWEWSYPLGVKLSVRPSILLNSRECSPLGVNERVNIPPRGQILPRGGRGEVKNGLLIFTQPCNIL